VDYEAVSPTVKITGTPDAGAQKKSKMYGGNTNRGMKL